MAEDTQRQECPHDDDLEIRPRTGTIGISEDGVPVRNIVSPYGGGCGPSPVLPETVFRVWLQLRLYRWPMDLS